MAVSMAGAVSRATTTRATRQLAGNGVAVPVVSASAVSFATDVAASKISPG